MRTGRSITKGVIWEASGVLMLLVYGWCTDSNVTKLAIGWPIARTLMWPAFEWAFKRIWRYATTHNDESDV